MLKNWLREPLSHFLLIGALLFFLYELQNDEVSVGSNRIVINEATIDNMAALWEKRRLRRPSQKELDGMIEQKIREEVFYREALAMGLDNNDSVVRRRLAQKVQFLFSDLAMQGEPTDAQLVDYLKAKTDKFKLPGSIRFKQVYFNTDKRGPQAQSDAVQLLMRLTQPASSQDISQAGDTFMFGQQYDDISETEVARLFGKEFTIALFALPVAKWQGPVVSAYGLHLVRIDNMTPPVQPDLVAVRDKVRNQWLAEQRRAQDESFYLNLRQRYDVVVETIGEPENL